MIALLRAGSELLEEPRLPNPRLADQLDRARVAEIELIEDLVEEAELIGTSYERVVKQRRARLLWAVLNVWAIPLPASSVLSTDSRVALELRVGREQLTASAGEMRVGETKNQGAGSGGRSMSSLRAGSKLAQ